MVGNLETKTGTAGETTFAYDENGRMLLQGDASARLDYVYGPGSYAVSRATGRTPMDGGVGSALVYEPFGFQRLLRVSGDEPAEQYTGKEYDGRLGLYYFGARYFDPSFALWLTPDPARQYLNPYSFGGDPVNAVDFDGRWSWKIVLGLGIVELATAGAVTSLIGAGVTTAAATATAAAGTATSPAIAPAAFNAPLISSVSGLIRGDFSASDVGNSFLNGLFIDAVGGVGNAAAFMTAFSYGRRCYYAEDCGAVVSDGVSGGFFVDDIGHMVGLANVAFMGGTADWFELGSVSSDYRGNTIYSGGFMNHVDGGGAFGGHATFVEDRKNREVIAHELNHTYQMEYEGNRFKYMYDYMVDNSWDPSYNSPTYYQNAKEMDSYYKAFLYENGCINVYGSNTGKCNNEKMSERFYNGTFDEYGIRLTYGYADKHPEVREKYGPTWTWRKNWWRDY